MKYRAVTSTLFAAAVAIAGLGGVGACGGGMSPQLKVIDVHTAAAREVVFVQVTNPASRPMRLTRLEYTFAADGATLTQGDVALARDVQPGSAVVVEVPLDAPPPKSTTPLTLRGTLTTQLDQISRTFPVSATVVPTPAP